VAGLVTLLVADAAPTGRRTRASIQMLLEHSAAPAHGAPLLRPDSDALPVTKPLGSASVSATWSVTDEARKSGAGILLFAYGGEATLHHFLAEATAAARSFRALESAHSRVRIAVVSNNATIDRNAFDLHIQPRPDLLFAGDPCPYGREGCNPNQRPRQWATRLYYLAHSPFELTWALDSNIVCCDPRAAARFLRTAEQSRLWGFDIATANQAQGELYPHNWNLMVRWSRATSNLMRDWLLLQFRRGLASDDQGTLFAAMQRQRASGGLRVGQVPTPFAAAFYSPKQGSFFPRITRPLTARAVVLHVGSGNGPASEQWCRAFNTDAGTRRQLWIASKGAALAALRGARECKEALQESKCPFAGVRSIGAARPEESVFQPPLRDPQKLAIGWNST